MTPVLRYFKNSYRKKNKHRYSVWTGIPPSSRCTHTGCFEPCPSVSEPQSPVRLTNVIVPGSFSRPWLGCKRWTRVRFSWTRVQHTCSVSANHARERNFWYVQPDCVNNRPVKQYIVRGPDRLLQRPKQLEIINHVNKTMHSPALSQSTYLPHSRAIGNVLFPTYEVVTSSLHSIFLLNE